MIITIESATDKYQPVEFISANSFIDKYGLFPNTVVRENYSNLNVHVLSDCVDLFKLPIRDNKEIDKTYDDGVIHRGANFKPTPFTLSTFAKPFEYLRGLEQIYFDRGMCNFRVETDGGTVNTFRAVPIEYSEDRATQLVFHNPSCLVDVVQNSVYIYQNRYSDGQRYLQPAPKLFANDMMYPTYFDSSLSLNTKNIFVANPDNAVLEFDFFLNDQYYGYLHAIEVDDRYWNAPEPIRIKTGYKLIVDYTGDTKMIADDGTETNFGRTTSILPKLNINNKIGFTIFPPDTQDDITYTVNLLVKSSGTRLTCT